MDCFGTYLTHVQTCDNVRVQSAMEWTASSPTSGSEVHKVHRLGLLAILLGPVAAPRSLVALSHLPFDLHDLASLALTLEI